MKKTFAKLAIASLLFSFVTATTLSAQDASKEEKKPGGMPFRGKISAVDASAKTITVAGKEKSRTFQATAQTKFTKDGKSASFDDAKAGEEVGGFAVKIGEEKFELKSLRIGPKPPEEKKEDKKEKKKKE